MIRLYAILLFEADIQARCPSTHPRPLDNILLLPSICIFHSLRLFWDIRTETASLSRLLSLVLSCVHQSHTAGSQHSTAMDEERAKDCNTSKYADTIIIYSCFVIYGLLSHDDGMQSAGFSRTHELPK